MVATDVEHWRRDLLKKVPNLDVIRKIGLRVLAELANPLCGPKLNALIDGQLKKYAPRSTRQTTQALEGWIEESGNRYFLNSDHAETVLAFLTEELSRKIDSDTVWALGYFELNFVTWWNRREFLQNLWTKEQANALVSAAIAAIREANNAHVVMRPHRDTGLRPVHRDHTDKTSLDILTLLDRRPGYDYDLDFSVANLVSWIVLLDPTRVLELVDSSTEPSLFYRISDELGAAVRKVDYARTLDFISSRRNDEVIALAIFESLRTVIYLRMDESRGALHPQYARTNISAADDWNVYVKEILNGIAERLRALDEPRNLQLLGQVFDQARTTFSARSEYEDFDFLVSATTKAAAKALDLAVNKQHAIDALSASMDGNQYVDSRCRLEDIASLLSVENTDLALQLRHIVIKTFVERITEDEIGIGHLLKGENNELWIDRTASALVGLRDNSTRVTNAFVHDTFLDREFDKCALSIWDYEENHSRFSLDANIAASLIIVASNAAVKSASLNSIHANHFANWAWNALWNSKMLLRFFFGQKTDLLNPVVSAVMMAGFVCLPDIRSRISKQLRSQDFPLLATAITAVQERNDDVTEEARRIILEKFEDLHHLGVNDARIFGQVFNKLGLLQQGLRVIQYLNVGDRYLNDESRLLALKLSITALEKRQSIEGLELADLRDQALDLYRDLQHSSNHYLFREELDIVQNQMKTIGIEREA